MSNATYYKTEKTLHKDINSVAEKAMAAVADEEKKFCIENQSKEADKYVTKCYADMAWCKRSYGTKYSAL